MTVYDIKTDFGATGNGIADDAPAFVAAGLALSGTSGHTLTIPGGTYPFLSTAASGGKDISIWPRGIKQLTIAGAGSSLTTIRLNGRQNQFAGQGQIQDGSHFGKIASVSAGSLTATLLTPADAAMFSVGQWVLVAGLNIQDIYSPPSIPSGYGYPANLTVFEYVQISAINAGAGVITFSTALTKSYLSTWPQINIGNALEVNAGGPAGIYSLPSTWDTVLEYQGIRFEDAVGGNQIYANGRSVTYRDCVFPNVPTPIPTQNQTWACYNCTATGDTEVDKLITYMIMDGCNWGRLSFQSSSVQLLTLTNSTITGLNGSAIDSVVDNVVVTPGYAQPGAYAYGVANSLTISNCSVDEWRIGGAGAYGASSLGTMSSGVMAFPNGTEVSAITDNGAGKSRYTVTSSAGYTAGKMTVVGAAVQELAATAATTTGNNVLTVASVPGWIVAGQALYGASNGYGSIPDGTTVVSKTSTTITLSANVLSTVNIGDKTAYRSAALTAGPFDTPKTILSIVDSTHIDMDIPFPTGFVLSYGATLNPGGALYWALPGKTLYWTSAEGYSESFKILGVTQDADKMYVQTDQSGGFPTIDGGLPYVKPVGVQKVYASGLTGSSPYNEQLMWSGSQGKPMGSYFKHTYTGVDPGNAVRVTNFGRLVSITVNVTKAYSGALGPLWLHPTGQFDNGVFLVDGVVNRIGWAIDLATVGTRVILPTNTVTNATKQTNDSDLLVPAWSSSLWMNTAADYALKNSSGMNNGSVVDISGESSSVWPSVTIEVITDQGVDTDVTSLVMPLRFRLHS